MRTIPYGRQQINSDDIKEVVRVLRSDWITQGPNIKRFEKALCEYAGAKYAVAVSSGTAALHIACLAAGIKKDDEVITSPITFVASANCVLYCGGKPVFADIRKDTANIDPEQIKKRINKKTKALIPVHFAGHPADLKEIYGIAKRHDLLVIEDATHALGAEYRGSKIGSCGYSDMAIFSFHPVKSITTGEGGAILTNSKDLYSKLLILRNHGITKEFTHFRIWDKRLRGPWYYQQEYLGFNYRITDLQCVLGISQLKKLDSFIKRRREIVQIYNKGLSEIGQLELPVEEEYVKSAWHLYPIRLRENKKIDFNTDKRKKIFNFLRRKNIGVQVHYIPVYLQRHYSELGYKKGLCTKAEDFYNREISIPLYPALKDKQIKYVINRLTEALNKYA